MENMEDPVQEIYLPYVQDLSLVLTPVVKKTKRTFCLTYFILYLDNNSTGMKILYENVAREVYHFPLLSFSVFSLNQVPSPLHPKKWLM